MVKVVGAITTAKDDVVITIKGLKECDRKKLLNLTNENREGSSKVKS